ncbi:ribosome production factor 1 (nucleomorph) [Cryptomonas paramecium]|uniref:Ribosome production factor 1 n=1 Tax=Cryptomonas paramaecium TaxID=2898 RepID=F2HHK1_9CRYP|nr:ribosome production factor 1 [Cryptomonas paramecium]AEA38797.1 ribosome production factor 1 [Cryptomonas paramecium]|mmetsp:Transcript_58689/g.155192  ORF Transcript_58689/g.155192 Transcript_58689/m.155192 type:complete len:182 (+) Transcript_58689:2732-3277(+)
MIGITTSIKPSTKILQLAYEFLNVVPNSHFFKRKQMGLARVLSFFIKKKIDNVLIFTEKRKNFFQVWHVNISRKAIIKFKIEHAIFKKKLKFTRFFACRPELIFYNFEKKIGNLSSLFFCDLFENRPDFTKRQVIFFCLSRNRILFRHYRYLFSSSGKDVKLQEIGPRFVLKILQICKFVS